MCLAMMTIWWGDLSSLVKTAVELGKGSQINVFEITIY